MSKSDALRTSLDRRQVDRKAGRDRDYVESLLRRINPAAPEDEAAPSKKAAKETTPSFDRVEPVQHPKKDTPTPPKEIVEFRQLTAKEKKARKKAARKKADDRSEGSPVVWQDVPEGVDPDSAPDPDAGFMKGNYALLRRQIDSDHAVYFFATEVPADAEQARVPPGYEVRLTKETRLPYIARRGSDPNLNQTLQLRAKDRDEAIEIAATKGLGGLQGE